MTRAVHLLTYLDSQTGGMERQALQLARRLRAKGCDIFFITCAHYSTMRKGRLRGIDSKDGIHIYRIPLIGGFRYLNMILYGAGAILLLFILRRHYEIIHAHQLYTSGAVGALAKLFLRSKKLIVKNCCGGQFGDIRFLKQLPLSGQIIRLMRCNVNMFISISTETRDEMEEESLQPIQLIPNGVDTAYFVPVDISIKLNLRKKMNILPSEKIVLFVGKFDAQKNVQVLLEAMRHVDSEIHASIVGDGHLRGLLEEFAKVHDLSNRVTFCGATENIRDYYSIADLFVLPSRAEGLSNVILEAMASGLPVIASDVPGNRFVIRNGQDGYLTPPENAQELAHAIEQVFKDTAHARATGISARKTAEERFSIDRVVDSYVTLYDALLKG